MGDDGHGVHRSILDPIKELRRRGPGRTGHWLVVQQSPASNDTPGFDGRSVQYLVNFLQNDSQVTDLELESFSLEKPRERGWWGYLAQS